MFCSKKERTPGGGGHTRFTDTGVAAQGNVQEGFHLRLPRTRCPVVQSHTCEEGPGLHLPDSVSSRREARSFLPDQHLRRQKPLGGGGTEGTRGLEHALPSRVTCVLSARKPSFLLLRGYGARGRRTPGPLSRSVRPLQGTGLHLASSLLLRSQQRGSEGRAEAGRGAHTPTSGALCGRPLVRG